MRRLIIILALIMIAGDEPETSCGFCGLRAEVHYFAIHLQQRLGDRSFDRAAWGMDRLHLEVNELSALVDDKGSHDDVIKEAIDVAIAAMMVAHYEGRR